MQIVLHRPEIPQNTGNIGRTCVATGCPLHLIEPLGFQLNEKKLKRSGMDYWDELELRRHVNLRAFREWYAEAFPQGRIWMLTTKAPQLYTEVSYGADDALLFGAESCGLPEEELITDKAHCIRIPMTEGARSLNLSNAVAVVLYEALRIQHFPGLQTEGRLHHLTW